jgi:hypothetical protein
MKAQLLHIGVVLGMVGGCLALTTAGAAVAMRDGRLSRFATDTSSRLVADYSADAEPPHFASVSTAIIESVASDERAFASATATTTATPVGELPGFVQSPEKDPTDDISVSPADTPALDTPTTGIERRHWAPVTPAPADTPTPVPIPDLSGVLNPAATATAQPAPSGTATSTPAPASTPVPPTAVTPTTPATQTPSNNGKGNTGNGNGNGGTSGGTTIPPVSTPTPTAAPTDNPKPPKDDPKPPKKAPKPPKGE